MNVVIEPHNPLWAEMYTRELALLRSLMGDGLVQAHHIGSTAVVGIWAKPIVDILLEVRSIELVDELSEEFVFLGYEPVGEYGIKGRRYLRKYAADGRRTHHVHAYEVGNSEISRHMVFRDYLMAHPEEAQQYSLLKQRLARAHPDDMRSYVDGKESFIRDMERRALEWARA